MQNEIMNNFENYCYDEDYDNIELYLKKYNYLANYDDGYFFSIIADTNNLKLVDLFLKYDADIKSDNYYVLYKLAENRNYDYTLKIMNVHDIDIEVIKHTRGYNEIKKNIINETKLIF
jgi:hypothetical protein